MSALDDAAMLDRLLALPDASDGDDESRKGLNRYEREAFGNMRRRLNQPGGFLTDNQRRFAARLHERFIGPVYLNEFSAGKVPEGSYGKSVTPTVLQKPLPRRPPGRSS